MLTNSNQSFLVLFNIFSSLHSFPFLPFLLYQRILLHLGLWQPSVFAFVSCPLLACLPFPSVGMWQPTVSLIYHSRPVILLFASQPISLTLLLAFHILGLSLFLCSSLFSAGLHSSFLLSPGHTLLLLFLRHASFPQSSWVLPCCFTLFGFRLFLRPCPNPVPFLQCSCGCS